MPLGTTPVAPVREPATPTRGSRPPAQEDRGPVRGSSSRRHLPQVVAVTLAVAGLAAAFVAASLGQGPSSSGLAVGATPEPVKILPGASAARVADDRAQSARHGRSREAR